VFGLIRLGAAIKFIPSGDDRVYEWILLIIFEPVKDLLGPRDGPGARRFLPSGMRAGVRLGDPWALVVAALAFTIILLWPKIDDAFRGRSSR
jgi:hypothetical protein